MIERQHRVALFTGTLHPYLGDANRSRSGGNSSDKKKNGAGDGKLHIGYEVSVVIL